MLLLTPPPPPTHRYNTSNLAGEKHVDFLLISLPLFLSGWASSYLPDHPRIGRRGASAIFYGSITLAIGAGVVLRTSPPAKIALPPREPPPLRLPPPSA